MTRPPFPIKEWLLSGQKTVVRISTQHPFLIYASFWLFYIIYSLTLYPVLERAVMMMSIMLCGLAAWLYNLRISLLTLLLTHPYHFLMLIHCTGDPAGWKIDLEPGGLAAQLIFALLIWSLKSTHQQIEEMNKGLEVRIENHRQQQKHITNLLVQRADDNRSQLSSQLCVNVECELSVLLTHLEASKRHFETLQLPQQKEIAKLLDIAENGMSDVQSIVRRLSLDRLTCKDLRCSLEELIRYYQESSSIQFTLSFRRAKIELPLEMAPHLYRIIHEAVTNAVRHAKASNIAIEIKISAQTIQIRIKNDGHPIPRRGTFGLGIRMISYRMQLIHGLFDYRSDPQTAQTTFTARIPVSRPLP